MMALVSATPLLAMLAIIVTTIWRGAAIRRSTGDQPWAFASAKGRQRIAGGSFALSVAALIVTAALAASELSRLALPAALAAIAGAAIVIIAQAQMGRAWRIGVREGDAPLFVAHGLFRYSRNPVFVGMVLVGLSAALAFGSWWSWAALALFVASCAVQVGIEEAHLAASFGAAYHDFCKRVPRWLGVVLAP